jgi:phage gp45-like
MPIQPTRPCCRRTIAKGQETLVIATASGQQITMQSSPGSVVIEDANGNTVRLDASGITITSAAKLTLQASQIEIDAGVLTVNASISNFGGVVQANTIIAGSIVPGASNIW